MEKFKILLRIISVTFLAIFMAVATACTEAKEEEGEDELPSVDAPVEVVTPAPTPTPDPDAGVTLSYAAIPNMVKGTTITSVTPTSSDISKLSKFKSVPNLPNGVLLNTSTGVISGKPTGPWLPSTYVISAKTAGGTTISATTNSFSVFANSGDTTVDTSVPHNMGYEITDMVYYKDTPIATNHFSVQGGGTNSSVSLVSPTWPPVYLPNGLFVDSNSGEITGTPYNALPRQEFTMRYTTTINGVAADYDFKIWIKIDQGAPTVSFSQASYSVVQGGNLTITPTFGGGTLDTVSISPALPSGLAWDSFNNRISGRPSALSALRSYTVTVGNNAGSTTGTFDLEVTRAAPDAVAYEASSFRYMVGAIESPSLTPIVSDYGVPTSYSVSPTLPAGLNFNTSTGTISGNATALQSATNYTVTASNSVGSKDIVISIAVISPGNHVAYTTNGSLIKAHSIDPVTGAPHYLGKSINSAVNGRMLFHPSADCAFGISSGGVHSYRINKSAQGELTSSSDIGSLGSAANLALHNNGNLLFVFGGSEIYAYTVNQSTCGLTHSATTANGIGGVVDGALSGDNVYVFTSSAHIKHFTINNSTGAASGQATVEMSVHTNPSSVTPAHGGGLYLFAYQGRLHAYDNMRAIETFVINGSSGAITSSQVNYDSGTIFMGRPALVESVDRLYTPFNHASWSGINYTAINSNDTTGTVGDITGTAIRSGFQLARKVDQHTSESGTYIYAYSEYTGSTRTARLKVNVNGSLSAAGAGLEGTISGY